MESFAFEITNIDEFLEKVRGASHRCVVFQQNQDDLILRAFYQGSIPWHLEQRFKKADELARAVQRLVAAGFSEAKARPVNDIMTDWKNGG